MSRRVRSLCNHRCRRHLYLQRFQWGVDGMQKTPRTLIADSRQTTGPYISPARRPESSTSSSKHSGKLTKLRGVEASKPRSRKASKPPSVETSRRRGFEPNRQASKLRSVGASWKDVAKPIFPHLHTQFTQTRASITCCDTLKNKSSLKPTGCIHQRHLTWVLTQASWSIAGPRVF